MAEVEIQQLGIGEEKRAEIEADVQLFIDTLEGEFQALKVSLDTDHIKVLR